MGKKKDLGRGIKALLSNIETKNNELEKDLGESNLSSTRTLSISSIERNPNQPRTEFDQQELEQLASSIKAHGIIQPITVRFIGGAMYQIISGERRFRAAKLAGLEEVPVYIREADDISLLEMALIENIQRTDLNALEIAISYQRLIEECNITHEDLSSRVGKQRSTISNYIRLLKLPPDIQQGIKTKKISMGHARVIAGLDNPALQLQLYQKIINLGLSVRAAESIASNNKTSKKPGTADSDLNSDIKRIQDRLSAQLGTKILIDRKSSGKGKIVIPFKSDKDFNIIIDTILED